MILWCNAEKSWANKLNKSVLHSIIIKHKKDIILYGFQYILNVEFSAKTTITTLKPGLYGTFWSTKL